MSCIVRLKEPLLTYSGFTTPGFCPVLWQGKAVAGYVTGGEGQLGRCFPPAEESGEVTEKSYIGC